MTPDRHSPDLSIGQAATLACLLEVTAPKVGNVHRGADFDDATLNDFVASAVAVGPPLDGARLLGVGGAVRRCIAATRQVSPTNTNLGAVLLLAPLAAAAGRWEAAGDPKESRGEALPLRLGQVWDALTPEDARDVHAAIALTAPGGLGESANWDVRDVPPASLLESMQLAASVDLVARQYTNSMADVLEKVAPSIANGVARGWSLPVSIVRCQLELLAAFGDSLILRKSGPAASAETADRAAAVLQTGLPGEASYGEALADFDFWLRSAGRSRNPGTTADLVAAGLFVLLWERKLAPPFG